MDAIHFQTEVGSDNTIRVPEGVTLPTGPAVVTVVPVTNNDHSPTTGEPPLVKREDYATTGEWLYAVGRQAETWDTNLPSDMAENHDFYAHGKPKE
jgi:hypothetical protein